MGGAEIFSVDLSNNLSYNNDVSICVLYDFNNGSLFQKINKNINVYSLNKRLGFDLLIFFKVWKLIIQINPDVIHTHGTPLFYSLFVILAKKCVVFHTLHNLAKNESIFLIRLFYRIYFKFFKVIPVSISPIVRQSTINYYGENFSNFINNGITKPSFSDSLKTVKTQISNLKKDNDTTVFINVARLYPQKNQELLVRCFNNLYNEGHNVILVILGADTTLDGNYGKSIKKNVPPNVFLLGQVNNPCDYLYCSDIFILSSLYEGLPLSLLEALSLGKYCVSTPAGGVVDVIINDKIGLVSDTFEIESFEKVVIKSTSNYKLVDTEYITSYYKNEYSMKMCSDKYFKLYSKYV